MDPTPVETRMDKLFSSARWLAAVMIPILGLGLLVFSVRNLVREVQLLNSPLDQVVSGEPAAVGNLQRIPGEQQGGAADFLPVVARADQDQERSAPALDQPLPDEQVQFLDHRVRLAVRGELSAAEAFIKPLLVPERLVIESLGVDHPVLPVAAREIEFQGETYQQWTAPRSGDLGWHQNSALAGAVGNTVINGHSSGYGETFQDLDRLENGDLIRIYAGEVVYTYAVANVILLKERWEPIEVRMENARWINRSRDERLTLISCWPANSNTHRVVVTALPVAYERLPDGRAGQPMEHVQAPGSTWENTP